MKNKIVNHIELFNSNKLTCKLGGTNIKTKNTNNYDIINKLKNLEFITRQV